MRSPFKFARRSAEKNVQIRLNGELLVDYVEPTPPVIPSGGEKERFLDHGTFALQCHNDGSKASYSSVRVRSLPDELPRYTGQVPVVDNAYREIIDTGRHNIPMVDYHVFLRKGLTLTDALRKSRKDGIQYGITANTVKVRNDADRFPVVATSYWQTGFLCSLHRNSRLDTQLLPRHSSPVRLHPGRQFVLAEPQRQSN